MTLNLLTANVLKMDITMFNGPNDYISDWTEQDGPYEGDASEEEYSDFDELRDRERDL